MFDGSTGTSGTSGISSGMSTAGIDTGTNVVVLEHAESGGVVIASWNDGGG
jgi:hypothetical protein